MMIKEWSPTQNYNAGELVVFQDKLFLSQSPNVGIIPIPLIDTEEYSNREAITSLINDYFPGSSFQAHSNRNTSYGYNWTTVV